MRRPLIRVGAALAALLFALPPGAIARQAPPAAPLKIVVIEGEDAVNIIQQKTAVAPVIEVRDRNDLPVPGALVTFAVNGGRAAAFAGGAPTLTVATNAAGQAVAAGFSPITAGAVQINVQAAFQGQVVAATITQTNVLTAAEAAAAAGAGGAGGGASGASGASGAGGTGGAGGAGGATGAAGAGAGGGLSAGTIGIVAGAVAGGAVAATAATRGGDEAAAPTGPVTYSGPLSGQFISTITGEKVATCTITRSFEGTMTMTLETSSDGTVSGSSTINVNDRVVSATCPVDDPTPTHTRTDRVAGTTGSFGYTVEETDTHPGPNGTSTDTVRSKLSFTGSLANGVVTGTLSFQEQATFVDADNRSASSGSVTFNVTLRP